MSAPTLSAGRPAHGAAAHPDSSMDAPVEDLAAVVLCGGESRRMGALGDKALLEVGGRTLLERAVDVLRELRPDVALACGPEPRYEDLGLELALDPVDGAGPLAGLVAALELADRRGATWLAVLACDMPRADAALLRRLHARAAERDLDACLFETADGLEPLYAVYRTTCLAPARRALEAGGRRLVSFHGADGLAIGTLREDALEARGTARNVNRPDDLGDLGDLDGREERRP